MGAQLTEPGTAPGAKNDPVLVRREGRALFLRLDRPDNLNALGPRTIAALGTALGEAERDGDSVVVVLEGSGAGGFSAGHDFVGLSRRIATDPAAARAHRRATYSLIRAIARMKKPLLVILEGIAIGAAVGIAAAARWRICASGARIALPETSLGMIPDAGLTFRLAHAPGRLGNLLGLTGLPVGAADALAAGFADGTIDAAGVPDLKSALANPFAGPIDQVIRSRLARPAPGELWEHRVLIDRAFAAATVRAITTTLERDASPFAARLAECLSKRSPLALEVLNRAIAYACAARSLDEALPLEYKLVCRMSEGSDAAEGVRALLGGDSGRPAWRPPVLADVDPALVDELFTPMLPGEELVLPASP